MAHAVAAVDIVDVVAVGVVDVAVEGRDDADRKRVGGFDAQTAVSLVAASAAALAPLGGGGGGGSGAEDGTGGAGIEEVHRVFGPDDRLAPQQDLADPAGQALTRENEVFFFSSNTDQFNFRFVYSKFFKSCGIHLTRAQQKMSKRKIISL